MIIKEYRIPLPMTVDEYRIAQLYMIQKKSRNETHGQGSGVEILENRPYTDGPGGSGQYTHKVYHVGMHIPGWFRSILPKAALRVVEESWNAYPYTRTRFTCPFVEKFSIDIETFYKTDTGENNNVFNLSPVEKSQLITDIIDIVKDPVPPSEYKTEEDPKLFQSVKTCRGPLSENWIQEYKKRLLPIMCAYKLCKVEFRYWGMQSKIERFIHDTGLRRVMVRAHRQAWCWQDEWYGLTMEKIRELEREVQLMLSRKMAQFSEEGPSELSKDSATKDQASGTTSDPGSKNGEPLGRGLKKQWSTSSKSSRSSKRGASPSRHSISEWRMQSIARDSDEGSEEEFFDAHENLYCTEEKQAKDMTKWNSNDLMDKMESPEPEESQDEIYQQSGSEFRVASSVEQLNIIEDEVSQPLAAPPSKIHVLLLVLHGGTILDTGAGDPSSKQGDTNTITNVFDTVMRVHYPSALGHLAIRLVPCPPICADAFALVSNLSPYGHDEGCLSSSQDHIPLAALPLLATSSPQYQEAVATVIQRANLAYGDFIKSQEGVTFNGQVCLIGDCVGGILAFDALCYSGQPVSESQSSSRRGSVVSMQDADLLSPGTLANAAHCSGGSGGGGSGGSSLESSRHLSRSNIDIPRSNGTEDSRRQLPRKRSDSSTYELDTIQQHQAFLSSLHASVLRNEPSSRRSSSSTMLDGAGALGKFDFEIADLFLFGCPLGLVLALRKTVIPSLDVFQLRPACQQVYNLFHPADPSASRLEPLLERRFHSLPPFSIPRYQRYPLGDGCSTLLADVLQTHNTVFQEHAAPSSPGTAPAGRGFRRASEISIASQVSGMAESYTASSIAQIAAKWWGQKRIDYALYCPDALTAFPTVALPHLFHASYWESTDVVSFLLRQVMRHDSSSILELDGKEVSVFTPSQPRERWQRKRTHVKLRNVAANHRINDAVANEDGPQVVTGRFMYGPLDMVTLTGEKVDVHIMTQPPSGEWLHLDTLVTNSSGRVSYTIPETHRLGVGVYPIKMVVRGDHTFADSYITVLPRGTEFVVFSIDGSFAASVSIMGSDPKVRAGAVDVVRHWQDLGYLIIYVTGRPDMQKQRVVAWLAQHNFPHGVVSFCDGLVHDPLRHKANFLKLLISELHLRAHAAYGSTKDVAVYNSISLSPMHIYIVGRPTKKLQQQCQFITDGYAAHLAQLKYNHRARPARNTATRMALRKGSFGLPGQSDFLRSRNHLLRTISAQPSGPSHRHDRTQTQMDSEQRGQRSMSVAASCWGRAMAGRLEPGAATGPK
ncbi:membrane-associated phosphatidylinositol transfer protein 2 isoform X5 [Mus musculus]|uniref:Isoform 2 of Membrane-associated phosphatidylinositol transfer protein 2 n=1 Tax=Mus musculus TaxID=10090 RepID=Q6ZPQ6-2|nr:membrane-associated phosphatidylinositol transfer protein 2 isoform 1 [Mus musculus]NP_035386.1 membrane-associated phosphatidylinositol transfer protein 2 isoform 1 [Mus musculus]XP_030110087.1 membrane-associated phosphatidylinositol transfer protein 2 isoform X5 [Mus musculus]AAD51375.1 M-RdgB2 retinal degeneration protein B subtype 2 [Mus musculus]EDL19601.1 phosphatidylinositol transfer protein, membrane-associated 2, isoform CRA_b [Mus musculus]|eukprot:NP_035386.1 membrane-associated phosphatidylinositol transfer protein 2 isoform 1 [Mus musculus]